MASAARARQRYAEDPEYRARKTASAKRWHLAKRNKDPEKVRAANKIAARTYRAKQAQARTISQEARVSYSNFIRTRNLLAAARNRRAIDEFRANGCCICKESVLVCLAAHHLDPSTKKFGIGSRAHTTISERSLREELQKCVCVCHNCHAKIHAGLFIGYLTQLAAGSPA